MRLAGVVYECVDTREGSPLSGIVRVLSVPGGLEVHKYEGGGETLALEDDDLDDNEDQDSMVVHTDEGKIHFVKLILPDFERMEGAALFGTPEFQTTQELQNFFYQRLLDSASM